MMRRYDIFNLGLNVFYNLIKPIDGNGQNIDTYNNQSNHLSCIIYSLVQKSMWYCDDMSRILLREKIIRLCPKRLLFNFLLFSGMLLDTT